MIVAARERASVARSVIVILYVSERTTRSRTASFNGSTSVVFVTATTLIVVVRRIYYNRTSSTLSESAGIVAVGKLVPSAAIGVVINRLIIIINRVVVVIVDVVRVVIIRPRHRPIEIIIIYKHVVLRRVEHIEHVAVSSYPIVAVYALFAAHVEQIVEIDFIYSLELCLVQSQLVCHLV